MQLVRVGSADIEWIECVRELFTEYVAYIGVNLDFQNFNHELEELPGAYSHPTGTLLLAMTDGDAAGCVAIRQFKESVCELKRMFVRAQYRGCGLGRRLCEMAIADATSLGYEAIRLDTMESMTVARKLYASLGFEPIAPYRENPLERPEFMELRLQR